MPKGILERITQQKCNGCYAITICIPTGKIRKSCGGPWKERKAHVQFLRVHVCKLKAKGGSAHLSGRQSRGYDRMEAVFSSLVGPGREENK
ncbi:MAG: hypothetical protein ACOYW7_11345 [Nitrospirota bacterium]